MNVQAKKLNGANSQITATINAEMLNKNMEKIAKRLSREAKVDGFRKGKVPLAVIKKQYGERMSQDAESEALRDVLDAGIAVLKLAEHELMGEPQVVKFDKNGEVIDVSIKIYHRPAIELGDYHAIIPEVKKPKVTKKAVADRLKDLAQAQAPFIDVTDRAVEDGDNVIIDFEGFVDGKPFAGGKAEQFNLKIGSGQFIPGFEEQLMSMNTGEEKEITVTFPTEYQAKELAGKETTFKIKLHTIQTKEKVRIDQKLAEAMLPGVENASVELLNEKIEEQIQSEEFSSVYNDQIKPELIEKLVAHYTFDIPDFIVDQEMDSRLNRDAQKMSEEEINELKSNPAKVEEIRETYREDATKSVKATFIIDALALAEKVSVDAKEVEQVIYYEALQAGQDPQGTLDQYKKAGYLPAIQMAMIEDRVLSKLLDTKLKDN